MKKILLIAGIILLIFIGVLGYFNLQKSPQISEKIFGATINGFYKNKIVKTVKPPVKKQGVVDPDIRAESAILIYEPNKYILYDKNSSQTLPIASITKVMTAMVSLDLYNLNDIIEIKQPSVEINGSKIGLGIGERITFENLLYGLLMNSGNDCADALSSGKVNGSEFVSLMNKKAKELNLENTQFKDSAGLDDSGHSSAKDVAFLLAYALKNETFSKIINTSERDIVSIDGQVHQLKSSNRLVNGELPLEGVIGGKTGFTYEAGHTLACAAEKDGHRLISVILKTYSDAKSASAEETSKLLIWGFDSYIFNY